ncbi:GNAT family N-acetyltransferase [Roseateles sp. DB2]|uniref:GNAT family N-acetyltransferase n=1 Tax=Roseateles sp. DB2 TaxID=3453717 RepID=UPI003EEDE664
MSMQTPLLTFRPIDLDRHGALCVEFRADSYVCGDGDDRRFWATAGPAGEAYLQRLASYMAALPGSCVHAWLGDEIVGQIELIRDPEEPSAGKVNLFYLRADRRGCGLGAQLEGYALTLLRDCGLSGAWLRVSSTNGRALAFYARHGWVDRGRDVQFPDMHIMRKATGPLVDDAMRTGVALPATACSRKA